MAAGVDLSSLTAYAGSADAETPLPVDAWNPPDCGDIDIRIARDGVWFHDGAPIQRSTLVRLFARLLRRDGERYVLVTPVEKLSIVVEDLPFLAVEMTQDDQGLRFRTNVGDQMRAGTDHPLHFDLDDGFRPSVHVRGGLWARLSRPLALDLAGLTEVRLHQGEDWLGVISDGVFFPIAPAALQTDF